MALTLPLILITHINIKSIIIFLLTVYLNTNDCHISNNITIPNTSKKQQNLIHVNLLKFNQSVTHQQIFSIR